MKGEWAPAHGHGETSRRTELKMHNVLNVFLLFAMQNASTTPRNAPASDHEIRSLKSNVQRLLLRCEMKFRSAHSRGLDSSDHAELQENIQNLILAFEKFHVCDEPPSVRLVRFQTLQIGYGIIKCVVYFKPTEEWLAEFWWIFNNALHRLANIAYTPNGRALIKEDFDKVYEDLKHERLKAFVLYPESYTSVTWTFWHFPSPVLKMLEQAFGASFNYNPCEPKMDESPKVCATPFAAPKRFGP